MSIFDRIGAIPSHEMLEGEEKEIYISNLDNSIDTINQRLVERQCELDKESKLSVQDIVTENNRIKNFMNLQRYSSDKNNTSLNYGIYSGMNINRAGFPDSERVGEILRNKRDIDKIIAELRDENTLCGEFVKKLLREKDVDSKEMESLILEYRKIKFFKELKKTDIPLTKTASNDQFTFEKELILEKIGQDAELENYKITLTGYDSVSGLWMTYLIYLDEDVKSKFLGKERLGYLDKNGDKEFIDKKFRESVDFCFGQNIVTMFNYLKDLNGVHPREIRLSILGAFYTEKNTKGIMDNIDIKLLFEKNKSSFILSYMLNYLKTKNDSEIEEGYPKVLKIYSCDPTISQEIFKLNGIQNDIKKGTVDIKIIKSAR